MKLIDLFSGIGGFSLAAHWMGWETIAFCEQDKFCQKVLRKNFGEGITIHDDIKQLDGRQYRGAADVVCGGFPCQPYSQAGKRKGKADDRHLWPEMLRVILEICPSWVVGENVLGLVNWSGGLVFHEVQSDLETAGYEVLPFVLPACAKDAPHRRDRVWFIAHTNKNSKSTLSVNAHSGRGKLGLDSYANGNGLNGSNGKHEVHTGQGRLDALHDAIKVRESADSGITRLQGCEDIGSSGVGRANGNEQSTRLLRPDWQEFPTESPVCGTDDGIPDRMDRIRSLGNSIVPQIAYEIFRAIEATEYEHQQPTTQTKTSIRRNERRG